MWACVVCGGGWGGKGRGVVDVCVCARERVGGWVGTCVCLYVCGVDGWVGGRWDGGA